MMREDPRFLLDSEEALAKYDPDNMLGLVEGAGSQWRQAVDAATMDLPAEWRKINRVVISGMGGSAIAADIVATYLSRRWPVSLTVIRDYRMPAWVDRDTLFVACSYSGNTEETLSAWRDAGERNMPRTAITTGGTLGEEAEKAGVPLHILPAGYPPRAALPVGLVSLLKLLSGVGAEGEMAPGGATTLAEMEEAAATLEELKE